MDKKNVWNVGQDDHLSGNQCVENTYTCSGGTAESDGGIYPQSTLGGEYTPNANVCVSCDSNHYLSNYTCNSKIAREGDCSATTQCQSGMTCTGGKCLLNAGGDCETGSGNGYSGDHLCSSGDCEDKWGAHDRCR